MRLDGALRLPQRQASAPCGYRGVPVSKRAAVHTVSRRPVSATDLVQAFQRQVHVLQQKGYHVAAGLSEAEFRDLVAPLGDRLVDMPLSTVEERIPFVLVVTRAIVPPEAAVPLIDLEGKQGWTDMQPDDLGRFMPIQGVTVPASAYLLADIDIGAEFRNVRPLHALPSILEQGRSPLTIDEGVALMLQFPHVLRTHNAFQMLASRCGDKRVPAMWVSYGKPRLGWCWEGNPHTWLGMGSAAARISSAGAPLTR